MIELRPFQNEALEQLRQRMRKTGGGHRRLILQAVTGAGKTVMASEMIQGAVRRYKVVLFVAHRKELIEQASDKLTRFGVRHSLVIPGHKPGNNEFCYVGTIQSFTSRMGKSFDPSKVDLIVIDEAHRSSASTYQKLIEAYPDATVIGLTATPTRGDDKGLGDTYTAMVQAISYAEAFEAGYLVRPRYYVPFVPDLSGVHKRGGDYAEDELEMVMNTSDLTGDIVAHYARHCRLPDGSYRKGIVFAVNVRHSIALAAAFNEVGIRAAHVDGTTPSFERKEIMDGYRSGEIDVLVNVAIATEGLDVPECSVVVLACPTQSEIKHLQTAGRGLRPHPESGKKDCLIIDHAGNTLRLGVVEDYNSWSLEHGSEGSPAKRKKKERDPKEITCDSCGHLFFSERICPQCGHEHIVERAPKDIEVVDGDLVELGDDKPRKYTQEEKQRWYGMMLGYQQQQRRNPNAAYWAFKHKFGVGPAPKWQKTTTPIPPDAEVLRFMKHYGIFRAKQWAKQQAEQNAALGATA